ncbi:MAG: hypothetical protein ACP6IY_05730 [Promethearchaeia archaeon]
MKKENNKDKKLIFFNEALKKFEYIDPNEINNLNYRNTRLVSNLNLLRDEMLTELNRLKEIISYKIDFDKIKKERKSFDKDPFYDFVINFLRCPVCGGFNHYYDLKNIYYNEKYKQLREELLRLQKIKNKDLKKLKISLGIPCCSCYQKYFEDLE